MYQMNCEVCSRPSKTVTPDKKHIICSLACKEKLEGKDCPCKVDEEERMLTSHGIGEVSVSPDRVRINLDIQREGKTFVEVDEKLTEAADNLVDLLKNGTDGRAEKIQTENLMIEPVYQRETRQQEEAREERQEERKITGYEGHFPVSFEAKVEQAGALFDIALKANYASSVKGLDYIVSDALSQKLYNIALKKATLDATMKSEIVLDALGLTKKAIMSVNIQSSDYASAVSFSQESTRSFASKLKMKKASIRLLAPEEKIKASVSIVMSYQ